jgi:hypothetical protein
MAIREFSSPHSHRQLYCTMPEAYGLAAPIATSLVGGGPATMVWGYVYSESGTPPFFNANKMAQVGFLSQL